MSFAIYYAGGLFVASLFTMKHRIETKKQDNTEYKKYDGNTHFINMNDRNKQILNDDISISVGKKYWRINETI